MRGWCRVCRGSAQPRAPGCFPEGGISKPRLAKQEDMSNARGGGARGTVEGVVALAHKDPKEEREVGHKKN